MIRIIEAKNEKELGTLAAEQILSLIRRKPDAVLGLATGSSPLSLYAALVEAHKKGEVSFAKVKTVNLDEYVGLAPDHEQSYARFMRDHLFSLVDIDMKNTHLPDGLAADPVAECRRYDAVVDSMGGVDLQVLGIGPDGHIGFNEPADTFTDGTNLAVLADSTIDANARFFASRDEVPTRAFSMGVGQIMKAKEILMVVLGTNKADILEKALFGEVTPHVPASILQKGENVTVYCDPAAASVIRAKHPGAVTLA